MHSPVGSSTGGVALMKGGAEAMQPPKKVIKALYDYNAEGPDEISFKAGEFFHVIGNEDDEYWYEAHDPLSGRRGLVPAVYFQPIERRGPSSLQPVGSTVQSQVGGSPTMNVQQQQQQSPKMTMGGGSPVTSATNLHFRGASSGAAIPMHQYNPHGSIQQHSQQMLYDFTAERDDELTVKSGEPIIIVAQSGDEWYVVRPIGRHGVPGLVPITYIEVRDVQTGEAVSDLNEMLRRNNIKLLGVEEWKERVREQTHQINKSPGISPMGRTHSASLSNTSISPPAAATAAAVSSSSAAQLSAIQTQAIIHPSDVAAARVSASIMRDGVAFFKVEVSFLDGRFRTLFRQYEDFYDVQIALLNRFPKQAGRTGERRILPFMPGPVAYVTDEVTNSRRQDLDKYIQEMFSLPPEIVEADAFQLFLSLRRDDTEVRGVPPQQVSVHEASPISPQSGGYGVSTFNGAAAQQYQQQQQQLPGRRPSGHHLAAGVPHSQLSLASPGLLPASATPTPNAVTPGASIKAKVMYQDDIIAIKLPASLTLSSLCDKITERLGVPHLTALSYRDATGNFVPLTDDSELIHALDADPGKLLLSATL
ncbi:hypothetical protein GQ42DRAFT_180064 [Ramicandelaber brevisporus]|nr:hypothetical protein GQ42DRAFT_180064 [Ramicandelaber brevisporus]